MQNLVFMRWKISSEIELIWNHFLAGLKQIEILRLKWFAFVQPKEIILSMLLRGFCDSSYQVYCGMVYILVETTLCIRVSFLCSKTKVVYLKKLSIPRLELLQCVLLSKVLKDVLVALNRRVSIAGQIPKLHCARWMEKKSVRSYG